MTQRWRSVGWRLGVGVSKDEMLTSGHKQALWLPSQFQNRDNTDIVEQATELAPGVHLLLGWWTKNLYQSLTLVEKLGSEFGKCEH